MATADATSSGATSLEVVRARHPREADRQSVAIRRGAARVVTSLVVSPEDSVSVESIDALPGVVAVHVENDTTASFALVSVESRFVEIARLGPLAASEEQPVTLDVRSVDGQTHVALVTRVSDACGVREVRVDEHVLTGARATPVDRAPTTTATFVTRQPDESVAGHVASRRNVGSHVLARFALAPLEVRAMRIRLGPSTSGRRDLVLGLGDERFAVAPSADSFDVVFDRPRDARCIDLELRNGDASSVTEIGFVPALDSDAARASALVVALASEGPRADAAIAALATIPGAALPVLEGSYRDALPAERRRILRAAEAISTTNADALRLFVVALGDDDEALRDYALGRCLAMDERGLRALSTAVRRGTRDVARPFAERGGLAAVAPILARLGDAEPDERRNLHAALLVVARRVPESRARIRTYVESDADLSARAVALAVLTEIADRDGIAAALDLWLGAPIPDDRVDVELRVLAAIDALPVERRTDPMKAAIDRGLGSGVWMVRAAAIAAAADDPSRRDAVRERLADETPRVRVAAIVALDGDRASLRRIGELSRQDAWPIVRLAALETIAPMPEAEPLVEAALTERSTRVRIGMLGALATRRDRRFIADVVGILERGRAPTRVLVAAVQYLEALCAAEAEAVLVSWVDKGLRNPTESEREIAVAAAHALERIGTPEGVTAARRLYDPTAHGRPAPTACSPAERRGEPPSSNR